MHNTRLKHIFAQLSMAALCRRQSLRCGVVVVMLVALVSGEVYGQMPIRPQRRVEPTVLPDSIPLSEVISVPSVVEVDSISTLGDSLAVTPVDTIPIFDSPIMKSLPEDQRPGYQEMKLKVFNPDPTRAVWLSALCPGLGQIYNRRFWKLPLVVAGFMGLGYGTSWNNMMLRDYTRAYADIMDSDPTTNSYMDFFPSTTKEEDLNKTWLTNILKSRKDYYRRNRDLCIICMVGVYFLAMVDAYVDASLAHFDITPDLSMQVAPALIQDGRNNLPSVGLHWAFTF